MVGSPEWREWDLAGLEVTFLHFDYRFSVDVSSGERSLSVVFPNELTLGEPGCELRKFDPEQNGTLGPLLLLLHRPVSSFTASSEGQCVLRFAGGAELRGEPHPQYEAWEASGTGDLAGIAMLCGPGGGSPWGRGQRANAVTVKKANLRGKAMQWSWARLWRLITRKWSGRDPRALFLEQRPQLQDAFFAAAVASGKPRGLRWKACEWESAVAFARERATGSLTALAGVVIEFEAVEGGDMEGVEAVTNLRNASAVFFFHAGQWRTTGKTVFNLNPDEALVRFQTQYERLKMN